jgi:hypothetical protein
MNFITSHPGLSLGIGAFVCGVAVFYLVVRRTMKHRENTAQSQA